MNAAQALEKIKATNPAEAGVIDQYIQQLHAKDVVALGTDEAFALKDGTGEIKAFKQRLTLSDGNGLVQPVYGGPYVVSAQGYEMWAEASGTCVIFPKTVIVDGVEQSNPHILRDPNNRRILNIYARAVAFRFSSKGLPMVCDWTTTFDVPSYRLIDLVGKAKKVPQAFRLLPSEHPMPSDPGTWATYPFDESTRLWVNTAHDDALKWYGEILNREKKAIDFAQTFARRNACKHLSGLQKAPGAVWHLPVICWRPTNGSLMKWDTSLYSSVQAKVEGLSEGQNFALPEGGAGVPITLTKGASGVDDEPELIDAEDEERQAEPQTLDMEQGQSGSFEAAPPVSAVSEALSRQLGAAARSLPEEYQKAKANLGIASAPANDDEARRLLAEINRIADSGE